jgi:hypothetical protein
MDADPVHELYVENGVMQIGKALCEGQGAIREFFVRRNEQETSAGRTTRHSTTGLCIDMLSAQRARIRSTVYVMAGVGEWPLQSAPPATVGDFEDLVICDLQGRWRYESRRAQILFVGAGAAAFTRSGN